MTLKDIRAKAATDAKARGYDDAQIQVALAHADLKSSRDYVGRRQLPISETTMQLPTKVLGNQQIFRSRNAETSAASN